MSAHDILKSLGLTADNSGTYLGNGEWANTQDAGVLEPINPSTGEVIARVHASPVSDYETIVARAQAAFKVWRTTPAPKRGEAIRLCGDALRKHKDALGSLVALEMGKIKPEGDGEVQEMIDIADFAVGQSRMLYGYTMHSERPGHRMYEQWQPLGLVGIISAFNFPVAVWAWNSFIAAICGDISIWKPSPKVPLSAVASMKICNDVLKANGFPLCRGSTVVRPLPTPPAIEGDQAALSALMHNMAAFRAAQIRLADAFEPGCTPRDLHLASVETDSVQRYDLAIGTRSFHMLIPLLQAQLLTVGQRFVEALRVFYAIEGAAIPTKLGATAEADRAWCLASLGRVADARSSARRTLALMPQTPEADEQAHVLARLSSIERRIGEAFLPDTRTRARQALARHRRSQRALHQRLRLGLKVWLPKISWSG